MEKFNAVKISIFGFITGSILPLFDRVTKDEIVFWLQVTSFLVAIVAGLLSIANKRARRK